MDPDRALVAAAARGDRDAFDELVRRHQGAMVTLARVLTSGRGDAEDLAQDVFVRRAAARAPRKGGWHLRHAARGSAGALDRFLDRRR